MHQIYDYLQRKSIHLFMFRAQHNTRRLWDQNILCNNNNLTIRTFLIIFFYFFFFEKIKSQFHLAILANLNLILFSMTRFTLLISNFQFTNFEIFIFVKYQLHEDDDEKVKYQKNLFIFCPQYPTNNKKNKERYLSLFI
jgi:hypothetical protein